MSDTYNKIKDAEDHVYWKEVAEILGCRLIGWTYRREATMALERSVIEVPRWLADRVRELAKARGEA